MNAITNEEASLSREKIDAEVDGRAKGPPNRNKKANALYLFFYFGRKKGKTESAILCWQFVGVPRARTRAFNIRGRLSDRNLSMNGSK